MNMRKAIATAVLAASVGASSVACVSVSASSPDYYDEMGGANDSYADTGEYSGMAAADTKTASEAFGEEGIWYYVSTDVSQTGRNTVIKEVLVFDGSGNVTSYYTGFGEALTLGDLRGKTDEEILQTAMAKDEEANLSLIEKGNANVTYENPKPQPYTLHIYTDVTGNEAEYEQITYPSNYRTNHALWGGYELGYNSYMEAGDLTDMVIYDVRFVGYKYYVTKTGSDSEYVCYSLDQPGAAGVDVD